MNYVKTAEAAALLVNGQADEDGVAEMEFVHVHTGNLPEPEPTPDPKPVPDPDPIPNPDTADRNLLPLFALLGISLIPVAAVIRKRKEQ